MMSKSSSLLLTTAVICTFLTASPVQAELSFFVQAGETVGKPYRKAQAAFEYGQYHKTVLLLEKLLKKIDNDEYLEIICRTGRIEPERAVIELLLGAARECQEKLNKAEEALRQRNFARAKEILEELALVSPKSNKIKGYLRQATHKLKSSPHAQH